MTGRGEPTVIYGASGFSLAIREMVTDGLTPGAIDVVAHIDDAIGDTGQTLAELPIISFETWRSHYREHACIVGVSDCAARRRLADRVAAAGGRFLTAWPPSGTVSRRSTMGEGTIVGAPFYLGPLTRIGRHVLAMPMGIIGHDVLIGDCCTLCSAANISGYVEIEDEVFIGASAVVVNGTRARPLRIGRGARIAAGAVVTKSVDAGATVIGNPAREIRDIARGGRIGGKPP